MTNTQEHRTGSAVLNADLGIPGVVLFDSFLWLLFSFQIPSANKSAKFSE